MSGTLNILVELLNEYRESECALDEDRLTWYATWLDKTPNLLYSILKRLEAENAELRKLLVDFRDAMWDSGEWTEPFDERMRELGVEVD